MNRLLFGKGLLNPTLRGEKKISLRRFRRETHLLLEGAVVQGVFLDGMDILLRITATTSVKPFSELTDQEAQEDGYADAASAFQDLKKFYPDLLLSDLAATIRFEVYGVDGVPAVSINEHA